MGNGLTRAAFWVLAVVMLAGTLASLPGAWASSTPNTLTGYVYQAGGASAPPVPAGVTVDLISSATHQVYSTTTATAGGQFTFTEGNTGGSLAPGWWGVWVPPQAHVSLYGCKPCGVLPSNQNPQYAFESQTALTSTTTPVKISGVSLVPYNATIWGNATYGSTPATGAIVQLVDPIYNGFVLANNTTVVTRTNTTVPGEFSLQVPYGSWLLETILPGSPNHYSYQRITVASPLLTVNPSIGSYTAWGFVDQAAPPNAPVPNGGNVTVFDPTNGYIYSAPTPAGGFYSVGTYPAGFTGPGAQYLDVILSPVGYQTESYALSVSPSSPSGGANPHNVLSSPIAPPSNYTTFLDFTHGFGKVNVTTVASLTNDSTIPDLANASVGQLWAQLGLDWQNSVNFSASNLAGVVAWVNGSGPFFPAGQADLTVNGTGFGQPTNYTLTDTTTCTTVCGLTSSATLGFTWKQSYNVTAALPTSNKSYALSFNFRHPTNAQTINYTFELPAGYVLSAGQAAPAQTKLVPAGPGGTWTSFTLASQPSSSASGTASLTVVKYQTVTANVNVTTSNFTFGKQNVLNSTHGNYTVILGLGQNATFTGLNSTFPAGTNGTYYQWNFGDGGMKNTSQPSTYHTYLSANEFNGQLTVTSSGGQQSSVAFHVWVDDASPTANISVNQTVLTASSGAKYVMVNWSRTLHFNASLSTDTLFPSASQAGVLSIAAWNVSSTKFASTANYSRGTGSQTWTNLTETFLGAGYYLTSGNVGGTSIAFTGWQYNVSLKVWDSAGHLATASLVVLVSDTQNPSPVISLLNSAGTTITSSGIVEGANHKALVYLSATNSSDPHNGSIVQYGWHLTDSGNASVNQTFTQNATSPSYKYPGKFSVSLDPQAKPYTVNLTVYDRAGNHAYVTASLTVAVNTSTRPVLSVSNLTAPSTMTAGSSYTVWVNVTNTIGKNSTAQNLSVVFYLLPPSGTGSQISIGGSPGSTTFYSYTSNTTTSSTPLPQPISLAWNKTIRAVIQFSPSRTGTWGLWANATASNEFVSDYKSGANQAQVQVTINANPITQYEEYAVIAIVAVVIIAGLVWYYRRGRNPSPSRSDKKGGSSGSSGKGGLERPKKDEDDDEE